MDDLLSIGLLPESTLAGKIMKKGWISVHRALTDHWLWEGEKFTKGQAWLDLLLQANHAPNKVQLKGRLIDVARGEQIRSQVTLSKVWQWNSRTVSRFLLTLEKEGMITVQTTELTTVITICNYDTYQDSSKDSTEQNTVQSAEPVHSAVQTNNNTNNKNNTTKPVKSKKFIPPKAEEVQAYLDEKEITRFTGEKFVAHYEATGWMRGNTKIKSWKACVTTWRKRNEPHQRSSNTGTTGKGATGSMLDKLR